MSFISRWFNRRKKHDDFEIEFFKQDIPISTLARWYIYDTELGEPNEVAELLGMTNVSEEGNEKEREDSDKRMDNIEYLLPYIDAIANISSDVITNIQVSEITKKHPDDKEEIEREIGTMSVLYKVIGMAAIVGAFSTAMEIGLIKPGDLEGADLLWDSSLEGDDLDE